MGKMKKENLRSKFPQATPKDLIDGEVSTHIESHGMALNRSFSETEKAEEGKFLQLNTDINLTASYRLKLTSRQKSLLLSILNYQSVNFGINFNMMLCIYYIYLDLLGNNKEATGVSDEYIRLTLTVSESILRYIGKFQLSLDPGQVMLIPTQLKEVLSPYLMSKRTYGSRFTSWRPEKFLSVRAVPVDIQFLERRTNSEPYSSYCKGYGESHPSARVSKTKPSSELDGTDPQVEIMNEESKTFRTMFSPMFQFAMSLYAKVSLFLGVEGT